MNENELLFERKMKGIDPMRYHCPVIWWLIFLGLFVSACDTAPSSNSSSSTPVTRSTLTVSVVHAIPSVRAAPSVHPTFSVQHQQVHAYIGSGVSAFEALYDTQGDKGLKGIVIWTLSSTHWVAINYDDTNKVYDLSYYFYPADQEASHEQDNVSLDVARSTCEEFRPPDSVLLSVHSSKPDPDSASGIQYIYKSNWLAQQLDASWFYFDEGTGTMLNKRNAPVDPGTYTLFALGDAQTGYEMCYLTTGIDWSH